MFRLTRRVGCTLYNASKQALLPRTATVGVRCKSDDKSLSWSEREYILWEAGVLERLRSEAIDGWELRSLINEMAGGDGVPEPEVVIEGLKACRRVNDIALAIRFIEMIRWKGGRDKFGVYSYMMKEVGPTMKELGIPTLEQLGYDKPELFMRNPDEC